MKLSTLRHESTKYVKERYGLYCVYWGQDACRLCRKDPVESIDCSKNSVCDGWRHCCQEDHLKIHVRAFPQGNSQNQSQEGSNEEPEHGCREKRPRNQLVLGTGCDERRAKAQTEVDEDYGYEKVDDDVCVPDDNGGGRNGPNGVVEHDARRKA